MWSLLTCLSIWSSKSDLHHHGYSLKAYRAEGQFIPWWYSLVSLTYVSFLRLDDQMRLPFGPDYCRHYCIFLPGTYQVILFSSTGIGLEVCLWRMLMLIVAAPTDLVLGLMLIVATPELLLVLNAGWFSLKPYISGWLYKYFIFTSLYTDNINIFRLVFCQNLCKFTRNFWLFCCKFLKDVEEIRS